MPKGFFGMIPQKSDFCFLEKHECEQPFKSSNLHVLYVLYINESTSHPWRRSRPVYFNAIPCSYTHISRKVLWISFVVGWGVLGAWESTLTVQIKPDPFLLFLYTSCPFHCVKNLNDWTNRSPEQQNSSFFSFLWKCFFLILEAHNCVFKWVVWI